MFRSQTRQASSRWIMSNRQGICRVYWHSYITSVYIAKRKESRYTRQNEKRQWKTYLRLGASGFHGWKQGSHASKKTSPAALGLHTRLHEVGTRHSACQNLDVHRSRQHTHLQNQRPERGSHHRRQFLSSNDGEHWHLHQQVLAALQLIMAGGAFDV